MGVGEGRGRAEGEGRGGLEGNEDPSFYHWLHCRHYDEPTGGKWYSHDRVSRYPYSVPQHAATDCDCAFERKLGQLLTIVFILMEWLAACSLSRVSRHLRLFSGCMTEYHFD